MITTNWRRTADSQAIEWGGREWTLDATDGRIGLRSADRKTRLLVLSGLAAVGRREDGVFQLEDRIGVELLHGRIQATYAPRGWHGLTVRACWGASPDGEGIDLEIQAAASTVGALRKLEVLVESTVTDPFASGTTTVEPRDRSAAALSYDGREPLELLERLTTAPVPAAGVRPFGPLVVSTGESTAYLEMVLPHDAARRLAGAPSGGATITAIRYGLFGHDLEKGVVLRGRLRGLWLTGPGVDRSVVADQYQRFVAEPPPLSG